MIDPQDEVDVKARQLRAAGVPLAEIERYVASKRAPVGDPTGHAGKPFVDAPEIANAKSAAKGHNGKPFVDAAEQDNAPDWRDKTMGVVAALNRDIPGAEMAQAGVRALVRRQPYSQARNDIRTAEDAAPAVARTAARVAGGGLAAFALPGAAAKLGAEVPALAGAANALSHSGALQGATFGGLNGALNSDLNQSAGGRAGETAIGAGLGGLVGGAGDRAMALIRGKGAPVAGALSNVVKSLKGRMSTEAPEAAPTLESLLAKVNAQNKAMGISEEGNPSWGDAEEAMGLAPHQQPDLEQQLRLSIRAKGAEPVETPDIRSGITGPGEPDEAVFEQGRANLRRANATDERSGLLNDLRLVPSSGGKLGRVAKTLALSDAGRVVPKLADLDAELGTNAPAYLRSLGISTLTPTNR